MRAAVTTRIMRLFAVLLALMVMTAGLTGTAAAAQSGAALQRPNLVVLGDSFAAGTGNLPYQQGTQDSCKRSDAAYGPILDRWGLVDLQAFVACSGATTAQVSGPGRDGVVQVDAITPDTDLVTVGALGNNFRFGDISGLCILADCTRDKLLPPTAESPIALTVGQVLDSISLTAPGQLDALYGAIKAKLRPGAKVLVVEYAAPFPRAGNRVGPLCSYMTADELVVAQQFTDSLNTQLRLAADRAGFRYVSTGALFRGHDVCGFLPAFYLPGLPPVPGSSADLDGTLHPNQLGQVLYAAAVSQRLYF